MPRKDERELAALAAKVRLGGLLGPVPPGTGWVAIFSLGYKIGSSEDPMALVSAEEVEQARKLQAQHQAQHQAQQAIEESRIVKPDLKVAVARGRG